MNHEGIVFPIAFCHLFFKSVKLLFCRIGTIGFFSEIGGIEFVEPETMHLAIGPRPEKLGAAFAGVAALVRRTVFDKEEGHVAFFLPEFQPVAPLLDRCPVQVAVDGEDLPEISAAVMIHRTGRINSMQNLFRQKSLIAPIPAERSETGFS